MFITRPLQKLSILVGVLIVYMLAYQSLFGQEKKKWRMGLGRMMYNVTYGYDTLRTSGSAGQYDTTISKTSSATVHDTVLVTEYLLGPGYGLELDLGIVGGERTFTMEESGSYEGVTTKIGDVKETVNTGYLLGGNLYFSNAQKKGFNWSFGVLFGTVTVKHDFTDGGTRANGSTTTDAWTNFNSTQSSSQSIPVSIMKLGLEYILKGSGFKFEYLMFSQQVKDSESLGTTGNSQIQYETITFSGGMGVVVFIHF